MDLKLQGKTAVVTGASRGIGRATVTALREEGVEVVAAARKITPELEATGAIGVAVDLSTPEGPAQLITQARAQLGTIDLLVNNVGGGDGGQGQTGGLLTFTDQQWYDTFELNFFAAVRTTRAALPALIESDGTIVNISSNGARTPHAGPITYTTAKAALTAFSRAIADEFGPQGVRVNTVSPGPVRTDMWESPDGFGAELAKSIGVEHAQLLSQLPSNAGMLTGRLVEPSEVATLVAYLASPLAASTTGTDHLIDAGSIKTV